VVDETQDLSTQSGLAMPGRFSSILFIMSA